MQDIVTTKYCSKCKLPRDKSEFYRDKKAASGLASRCKTCSNETHKEWHENNPSKNMEYFNRSTDKKQVTHIKTFVKGRVVWIPKPEIDIENHSQLHSTVES